MDIQFKKFGTTLVSRQAGSEAYNAFKPSLKAIKTNEDVTISFDEVVTFSPSWGDEFLTPIIRQFGGRVKFKKTTNPSVVTTLKILEKVHNIKFNFIS